MDNGQPTAVVYRTEKGWKYGITGKKSHGGGHKLCSEEYYEAVEPLCTIARWKRPFASGVAIIASVSWAPADSPNTVTFPGSPPKAAMPP